MSTAKVRTGSSLQNQCRWLIRLRTNPSNLGRTIMNRLALSKSGFTVAAGASFLFSIYLWFSGQRDEGVFVGLWVPSILSFGSLIVEGRNNA